MGSASSQPASAYLTLAYDHRSVLILRPPTLAAARDKAVELFALDLTASGQQVRLLLDGVELSDEVWGGVVMDGTKLQVELTGKRRRRSTTEGEGEAPDRKRVVADAMDDSGIQKKEESHHHTYGDSNAREDSPSTPEPGRDKGKGKAKADTSTMPLTRAELDMLKQLEPSQKSFAHKPGCQHFNAAHFYDDDEDDESIIVQEHSTGRQWRIPYTRDSEMTLGALLRAVEKKTGESRDAWTLVGEDRSELDAEREWKALSKWGIGGGSRIRLVYEGELVVFAVVLEPRNTFFVEALTTDTIGDVKKKLSFQVSTPPSAFILADWSNEEVADETVLGDYASKLYGAKASLSFGLWDPEELNKHIIKKEEEERIRQLRISAQTEGSAIAGPAPKEKSLQGGKVDPVDTRAEGEALLQVAVPFPPAPASVVDVEGSSAMEPEVGEGVE